MDETEMKKMQEKLDNMLNLERIDNLSNFTSGLNLSDTYKCPICGKEHKLDDCIIVKEETDRKFLNRTYDRQLSTYKTKVYQDNYLVSYYNIRICPKCAKERRIPYLIISALIIIALVALMIGGVIMSPEKNFDSNIGMILLVLFGGGLLGLFIYGGLAWIVQQCQTIDIEKAKENNAIVPANPLLDL